MVLINEFSPSTETEWIELYNDGDVDIDLANYLLEDGNSNKNDDLVLSGTILAKGFVVFNHAEGWLNNGGDTVKLYNNASPSAIIDQYTYGSVDSTKSVARIPNGSENWQVTTIVTNNSSNPSPTSIPTSVPTSVSTQTATPTPTAQPTLKPTPTKTPTSKPSPTTTTEPEETKESQEPDEVQTGTDQNTPQPTGQVAGATVTKKSPVVAIVFIFLGVCCLGYVGYMIYNMNYKNDQRNDQIKD
jgi:hypothetical protein